MAQHIGDDGLVNAIRNYVRDISNHCKADGCPEVAVMVLLARPRGDGYYKVFCGGAVEGHSIPGGVARSLLDSAARESSSILPGGGASRLIFPG